MDAFDKTLTEMDFALFGSGRHKTTPKAFLDAADGVFLDLRSEEELAVLPVEIPGLQTLRIPLHELPRRWKEIPAHGPIGLFCSSDTRSSIALAYLRARGLDKARIVAGGYEALVAELKPGKLYKRLPGGA